MAKGGAPAVILRGQEDRLKDIEAAIRSLGEYSQEIGQWMKMMNTLFEIETTRLIRLEEEVFGVDYGLEDPPEEGVPAMYVEGHQPPGTSHVDGSPLDDDTDVIEDQYGGFTGDTVT